MVNHALKLSNVRQLYDYRTKILRRSRFSLSPFFSETKQNKSRSEISWQSAAFVPFAVGLPSHKCSPPTLYSRFEMHVSERLGLGFRWSHGEFPVSWCAEGVGPSLNDGTVTDGVSW